MLLSYSGVALTSIAAFLMVAISTPVAIRIAAKAGAVDRPDGGRKQQTSAVPLAGGTVIFLTFIAISGIGLLFVDAESRQFTLWLSILIPAAIVYVVGLYDDLYTASPTRRLVLQSLAAAISSILTLNSETHIELFSNGLLNQAIGIFWIVTLTNAFNFIDNMDGHSLSISAVAAASFTLIAAINGQWLIAASAATIGASAAALLLWNWNPAKIYLGDGGALFIGFMLATLSLRIELTDQSKWISAAVPLIVLVVPLLDITVAVFGRLKRGISPLLAGRDHLSHRVNGLGPSVKATVILISGLALVAGSIGIYLSTAPFVPAAATVLAFGTVTAALFLFTLFRTNPL